MRTAEPLPPPGGGREPVERKMPDLALVIFDCDGVLVDSEPVANRVFCSMLNELGLNVTLEYMYEHFVGLSMPQCMERVAGMLGAPPPADFVARLQMRTEAALRGVEPIAGVPEVLDAIRIPFCVASSGWPTGCRPGCRASSSSVRAALAPRRKANAKPIGFAFAVSGRGPTVARLRQGRRWAGLECSSRFAREATEASTDDVSAKRCRRSKSSPT